MYRSLLPLHVTRLLEVVSDASDRAYMMKCLLHLFHVYSCEMIEIQVEGEMFVQSTSVPRFLFKLKMTSGTITPSTFTITLHAKHGQCIPMKLEAHLTVTKAIYSLEL